MTSVRFATRIDFVIQLARRLHAYGTTAQRLEAAICAVSARLGLTCNPWVNPTGLVLSFADAHDPEGTETTRVLRMEPGEVDLRKLCAADAIAERVMRGELGLDDGARALKALESEPDHVGPWRMLLGYVLTSASVAALLRTGWPGVATAGLVGLLIGLLSLAGTGRPRLGEALEALSAMVATFIVFAVAYWLVPLPIQSVVVASLIVLLPGLMLTNAVSELSSRHLVAGTARFAGAMAILLKLTFGAVAAAQTARLLGWVPLDPQPLSQPVWLEWLGLLAASFAFAILFRADRRDYLTVMLAAWVAYLTTRYAGAALGSEAGVFTAGMVIGAGANLYARWFNRPGAVVRVPGIILLVPGSVGFRSLTFALERDVLLSLDTGFALLAVLISLVAGLLFGNLLVPARHDL